MKRLATIFMVFAMLLTLAPINAFAADTENSVFSDMKETDYYAKAATALEQSGIPKAILMEPLAHKRL